jgi:ketosteroid isomerase-like protein
MSTRPVMKEDLILPYRQGVIKAAKAGDIEALMSFVTDDIVSMSPNDTTIYGKAEYRAWWEEYFQYFRLVAFSEPERNVIVNGDFATELADYMIAVAPVGGGTRLRDDGRTLTIWKRQPDDSWKMWQTIWNSTKPIGIGTNRYMSRLMQKKTRSQKNP